MCKHWRGVVKLIGFLKGCIGKAGREDKGESAKQCHWGGSCPYNPKNSSCFLHYSLHKLPLICILVLWKNEEKNINILKKGKCIVKTNAGYFKSVTADLKLQESKEYLIFRKERYTRVLLARR